MVDYLSMLNNNLLPFRIATVAIAKDVSTTIVSDFNRINGIVRKIFKSNFWFIVESNSTDNSVEMLNNLARANDNFEFVSLAPDKTGLPRFDHMSLARNRYLEEIFTNQKYCNIDYVFVIDLNGLNNKLTEASILSCFQNLDWEVCTANQDGPYYDVWALRHPLWSPNDCWESHKFFRQYMQNPEKALFASVQSRMITIPKSSKWIQTNSSFGGAAFYKKDYLKGIEYSARTLDGRLVCEHVPLHEKIEGKNGRIYINPQFINTDFTDHSAATLYRYKLIRYAKYPFKYLKLRFKNG